MKTLIAAAAVTAMAGSAMALELGGGISLGATVSSAYNVDTDIGAITASPELSYNFNGVDISAGMMFDLWDAANGEFIMPDMDALPLIDLGASYTLDIGMWSDIDLSMSTSWDLSSNSLGDVTVMASFSF